MSKSLKRNYRNIAILLLVVGASLWEQQTNFLAGMVHDGPGSPIILYNLISVLLFAASVCDLIRGYYFEETDARSVCLVFIFMGATTFVSQYVHYQNYEHTQYTEQEFLIANNYGILIGGIVALLMKIKEVISLHIYLRETATPEQMKKFDRNLGITLFGVALFLAQQTDIPAKLVYNWKLEPPILLVIGLAAIFLPFVGIVGILDSFKTKRDSELTLGDYVSLFLWTAPSSFFVLKTTMQNPSMYMADQLLTDLYSGLLISCSVCLFLEVVKLVLEYKHKEEKNVREFEKKL